VDGTDQLGSMRTHDEPVILIPAPYVILFLGCQERDVVTKLPNCESVTCYPVGNLLYSLHFQVSRSPNEVLPRNIKWIDAHFLGTRTP
jgi:hypothetical protein